MRDLLVKRAAQLPPPIQMSDAASRNVPKVSEEAKTTLANCLAHGRRHVVDAVGAFPDKCQHILEAIGKAFKADAEARALGLDPAARLRYHKQHSQPVMKELHRWLQAELDEKRVEPASNLGKAIKYLLTHWRKLTLFMSVAGAPIDNNICERAIKKAVLQRKNSYFFRSLKGADVSDIYMSLIHTCELNGVGAFDYLTQVLKNDARARANPGAWLPWNYREQLCPALVEV